jgi:Xaa-Pro aminopeptidase
MEAESLDVLVLGRTPSVRYACGARLLWRPGAFPFAPLCIVVKSTQRIHLLSTWDDGIPEEIGRDNLYGLFWNPVHLIAALQSIPGLDAASSIGTDSATPGTEHLLSLLSPSAEFRDATPLLEGIRQRKDIDEITCLTRALALAEAGYDTMLGLLRPEVSERTLAARFFERVCELGAPTPASESVVSRNGHFGGTPRSQRLEEGDLVTFTPSALYAGYEGGFGRTIEVGPPTRRNQELIASTETSCHQLIERCVSGAAGSALLADGEALGLGPEQILIHGLGLGAEWPLLGFGMGTDLHLETGMVLSVHVRREGADGRSALCREMVQITDDGPVTLSRKAGQ